MNKGGSLGDTETRGSASGLSHLVNLLNERELEQLSVSAIKEHRRRLATAEKAYDAWVAFEDQDDEHACRLQSDYVQAMLDCRSHMSVVEVLIDKLGRIPTIDGDEGTDMIK